MTEIHYNGHEMTLKKSAEQWVVTLKRSDIATQNMAALQILEMEHALLLPMKTSWDEEQVTFIYTVEEDGMSFEDLKHQKRSDQFRILLNVLDLEACRELPITFFLHPETLFFTKNGVAKLSYRALPELMFPEKMNDAEVLRQVKSFIVATFLEEDYDQLVEGALEVLELPPFLKEIIQAPLLSEVRYLLHQNFREQVEEERRIYRVVPARKYQFFQQLSIWASVLFLLCLAPLLYFIFSRHPFTETLLQADEDFIKLDYSEVISDLEMIQEEDLPYTQKYELAYSFVKVADFSKEQQETIMNTISLKSDELLLDYWIQAGRSQYEEAVDTAKRLEDDQLLLYALEKRIDQVREDDDLSGDKREELLKSLQSSYDETKKRWDEMLQSQSNDDNTASSTTSSQSATSSGTQTSTTEASSGQ